MTLAVVLVDDLAEPVVLCGRPVVEWLRETVAELGPDVVVGPGQDTAHGCDTTLVLPCSAPLLRPHTLRRLLGSLDSQPSAALELARAVDWWAEPGEPAPSRVRSRVLAYRGTAAEPSVVTTISGVEALSVHDPAGRVAAEQALYAWIAAGWLAAGVVIEDPATTRIDATVRIAPGAQIRPYTELIGTTVVGRGSRIGPVTTVRDSVIGEDCLVQYAVCQDVEIGSRANVGPYTWLRTGSKLGERCRAGAFVEVSDSILGPGTEVPHLAGLFSADVGRDCNVASMAGSLNFNGGQKRRTRIGDEVSIGSGSILIAPVSIGDRAETAAGSVITEDVPDGALGLCRTPQRNVAGWAALRQRQRQS